MLPTAKVVQQSGLVGMAQLLGGADKIHINQRMMMLEALSCGMFEQKNKFDIKIGDKEGATVMVANEVSKAVDAPLLRAAEPLGLCVLRAGLRPEQRHPDDGAAGLQVRRLLRRHVPLQLAQALHGRRLLHVPRDVRRGGHAARRHGHGRAGRRAPERQAPRGHPPADAVLHAAHGRLHADARRLPGAGRDALRADHGPTLFGGCSELC